jgi:hypothetical protein
VEQDMGFRIFGREIPYARARLELPEIEVVDLGPADDGEMHTVELRPAGGPASLVWKLAPPVREG